MVKCQVCGETVPNVELRAEYPVCPNRHSLGMWMKCGNESESHVYLGTGDAACPVCGNASSSRVERGTPVRCLHRGCLAPSYTWMVDGPPCYLNHLTVIAVDRAKVAAKA